MRHPTDPPPTSRTLHRRATPHSPTNSPALRALQPRHRAAVDARRLQLRRRWLALDELHVLGEAPHGRAALAVERDDEVLAFAARRDECAEGVVFAEAHAGEAGGGDAGGAGEEVGGGHGGWWVRPC